jgi:hypothetical protein
MATIGYIAATVPAKTDRVSDTTLFHLAMLEFGDALWWTALARMNGTADPWVAGRSDVLIPPTLPAGPPDGLLWS